MPCDGQKKSCKIKGFKELEGINFSGNIIIIINVNAVPLFQHTKRS